MQLTTSPCTNSYKKSTIYSIRHTDLITVWNPSGVYLKSPCRKAALVVKAATKTRNEIGESSVNINAAITQKKLNSPDMIRLQ